MFRLQVKNILQIYLCVSLYILTLVHRCYAKEAFLIYYNTYTLPFYDTYLYLSICQLNRSG